jgi:hypothetical protein
MWLDFTVGHNTIDKDVYVHRWETMIENLGRLACPEPKSDVFGACLKAALDFNAYDVNMIEALAGFSGLDDLMPVSLSSELVDEVTDFIQSPSMLTALTKAAYLSASTYLYGKYVTGNNIADLEQLLGLSGSKRFRDAIEIAANLKKSISTRQEAEWNFRLAKMARKIVYKYDYLQDSYGAESAYASTGLDSVTVRSNAHLCATPGPLRDMSTSAIILDDIGMSLRASRLAQAVKFEFIANWFIPIEENLDRLEFNSVHLNQLYRVKKLTTSVKVKHTFNFPEIAAMYGLSDVIGGYISTVRYHRWVSTEFPNTTFQHPSSEGLSFGRLLQGSALIITALGR